MASSYNNSKILRKDVSDIFDQLRKRAEDISTSEGSYRLIQNLSNPTNLTNPQIISMRRIDNYPYLENSKINRFSKVKTRNIARYYKNDKYLSQNNNSDLEEKLILKEQAKKVLLRKEQKQINNKSLKGSQSQKNIKDSNFKKFLKAKTMDIIDEDEKDIWKKLKNINKNKKIVEIRVNKRKYVTSREYLNTTKKIQLMKYIRKNKIEKYNMISNLKKFEITTLNKTMESLENNKEAIITNYRKKYIKYISYLNTQKDEEAKKNTKLMVTKERIKNDISTLESKINKVYKDKMKLLNLILLFIQYKEKIITLPDKAIQIFGDCSNNGKNNALNIYKNEDLNKILKYKGKIIYKDYYEFEYDYFQMDERIKKKMIYKDRLQKEIYKLKSEYLRTNEDIKNNPNFQINQKLENVLDELKFKNEDLKLDLKSVKIKFNLQSENTNLFKSRNAHIKKILSRRSSPNSITDKTNQQNSLNYLLNKENLTIYNPKPFLSLKKQLTTENFNFKKPSKLFYTIYSLYSTVKDNYFTEKELNFDLSIQRGESLEPEKSTILKMLEYIDIVINLLLKQKTLYLSDKKLKKKYDKIKDIMDKEKRRMQFIISFRKDEEKRKLILNKLSRRQNKVNYISSRKVENKFFFKAQKDIILKNKNLAEIQKLPTFEDFMYDVND